MLTEERKNLLTDELILRRATKCCANITVVDEAPDDNDDFGSKDWGMSCALWLDLDGGEIEPLTDEQRDASLNEMAVQLLRHIPYEGLKSLTIAKLRWYRPSVGPEGDLVCLDFKYERA